MDSFGIRTAIAMAALTALLMILMMLHG